MIKGTGISGPDGQGCLDGKSIVRFTHSTDSAAGTEIHLRYLNRALLQRNTITIFQLYMPDKYTGVETHSIGKGTLVTIPLRFIEKDNKQEKLHNKITRHLWYQLPGHDCYNPYYRTAVDFEKVIRSLFTQNKIDIAVNHFPGGLDSLLFMKEARKRDIPVCVINHFNNRWFSKPPIRKQLYYSLINAGLSNIHVPRFLKKHFVNISNGIDTDFFNPDTLSKKNVEKNILFLPARVVPNKGHQDLLIITNHLKAQGIDCRTIFAGKIYDIDYKARLDQYIERYNLSGNVLFTGQLSQEALRQWYRDSALLVLPTSHDEGLPRVVIEAQSMKTPPVCYDAGGTSEAIRQNITGYFVRKNDLGNLHKHIIKLLSDDTKRQKMGASGRDFVVEKFSLEALAMRHEQLYRELISRFGSSV